MKKPDEIFENGITEAEPPDDPRAEEAAQLDDVYMTVGRKLEWGDWTTYVTSPEYHHVDCPEVQNKLSTRVPRDWWRYPYGRGWLIAIDPFSVVAYLGPRLTLWSLAPCARCLPAFGPQPRPARWAYEMATHCAARWIYDVVRSRSGARRARR